MRNNINNISHSDYFMVCAANTGVVLYWDPYQSYYIHISHHDWFDKYNYRLSIEDKHTPRYLLIQQNPKSLLNSLDMLNLIPHELGLTSPPFFDTKSII